MKRPTAKTHQGDETLEHVAQSGWEVSICGDTQSLTGHKPGQPAPVGWTTSSQEVPSNLNYFVIL